MATRGNKGPLFGSRVTVVLPFTPAGGKGGKPPVYIKRAVAEYFGFKVAEADTYTTVNKNAKDGRKSTKRVKRGTYQYKSITLYFVRPQPLKDPKSNKTRSVSSVSMPLPKGTHVGDAYDYLNNRAKNLKLDKMITPDGYTIPFQY